MWRAISQRFCNLYYRWHGPAPDFRSLHWNLAQRLAIISTLLLSQIRYWHLQHLSSLLDRMPQVARLKHCSLELIRGSILIPAPQQTGSLLCSPRLHEGSRGGWNVLHQEAKRDLPSTTFLFITIGDARCRSTLEEISQYTSDHCTHEISQKWRIPELPRIYLPPSEYRCITKFCNISATSCLSCPISTLL